MTDESLQQFIKQIEGVNAELKSLSLDRSEIFKAAKQRGYDTKILRRVIAERAKRPGDRAEEEEVFRLYWQNIEEPPMPLLREVAQ